MGEKKKLDTEEFKKQLQEVGNLYWGTIGGNHDDSISRKPNYIKSTGWPTLSSDIDHPIQAPSELERLNNKVNTLERKVDALVSILSKVVKHEEDLAAVRKVIEE